MKTAKLTRNQVLFNKTYPKGSKVTVVKKVGRNFHLIRTPEGDKQVYTADLESFKTTPTKASIKKEQVLKAIHICEGKIAMGQDIKQVFNWLRSDFEAIGQGEILYK